MDTENNELAIPIAPFYSFEMDKSSLPYRDSKLVKAEENVPSLPYELWLRIIECLLLPPPRLGSAGPEEEYQDNQAILHKLCSTATTLKGIAEKLLYRTIILHQANTGCLLPLLRTLLLRPDLRPHVKQVALTDSSIDVKSRFAESFFAGRQQALSSLPASAWEFLSVSGLGSSPTDYTLEDNEVGTEVGNRMFATLLCLCPQICTLLLDLPCTISENDFEAMSCVLQAHDIERTVDGAASPCILPRLHTLQLQARPPLNGNAKRLQNFRIYACPTLFAMPNLRRLETYQADEWPRFAADEAVAQAQVAGWLAKIEQLHLSTSMRMSTLEALLGGAHSLKKLTLILDSWVEPWWRWCSRNVDRLPTCDSAICARADTLEELCFHVYGQISMKGLIGRASRLECLPKLTRLRVLETDLSSLFESKQRLRELGLADLLPPNLEHLKLHGEWYTFDESVTDEEYQGLLQGQFERLADKREWFPHLKVIDFFPTRPMLQPLESPARGTALDLATCDGIAYALRKKDIRIVIGSQSVDEDYLRPSYVESFKGRFSARSIR